MKLSCFIIDDEPLALGLIESYVEKTPFLELTGKFSSAINAVEPIRSLPPDIIYLDIQMAELNGMEFAQMIPEKTRVIFTTAFEQYALESYKVNALDYLLKPFGYADFLAASNKALQWFQLSKTDATEESKESASDSLFVKTDYRLLQIKLGKILFIEGLKDYLKIYLEDESEPVITRITMKAMEEMLPLQKFLRVHRSFIVQTDKIKIIERNCIVFGKKRIPVSDSYKDVFQQFLDGKTIK